MTSPSDESVEQAFQNALALHRAGQLDAAADAYRRILATHPDHARALHSLGVLEKGRGNAAGAVELIARAISLLPDAAEFHNNLGDALMTLCRYDEAIASFRRSIELSPQYVKAYNNLGNVLARVNRHGEAVETFERALKLQPDYSRGHANLAVALTQMGRQREAIESYRRALQLDENNMIAQSNLLMATHYLEHSPAELSEAHRRWAERFADPLTAKSPPHQNDRDPDRRLRIGYVSGDFNEHAVSSFFLPVLRNHDRGKFHITCYSNVASPDATTQFIRDNADEFRELVPLNDDQSAELVRADAIDILIDLSGHSARHRLRVFARKPAPVQATWLGYPDTTGMAAMDYRITDAVADPVGQTESLHRERLIRLSSCWCYQPPLKAPPVAPPPSAGGAPMTFGSFNTLAKVSPATLKLWKSILAEMPGSRLVIKAAAAGEEQVQRTIRGQLGDVALDRVIFLPREPDSYRHLETYGQIDIILDTHPYNGTTMTCEALWMGVPVITLAGDSHVSRVGASLLSSVGLPELIARDSADYITRARSLAENVPRLQQLRQQMRQRLTDSPLLDQSRFTRELEAAYRQVWQAWCI